MHLQDKSLVTANRLSLEWIYTIRSGERVRDDVAGGVLGAAAGEIVKIREAPGSRACVFFDSVSDSCTIYDRRPLECRVLRCWDTDEIRRIYRRERLARRDLVGHIEGLWDLVVEHERRCGAARLFHLADRRRRAEAVDDELRRMVAYDEALRLELIEQRRLSAAVLDFLLGRPLTRLLHSMGIGVERRGERIVVRPRPFQQDQPA